LVLVFFFALVGLKRLFSSLDKISREIEIRSKIKRTFVNKTNVNMDGEKDLQLEHKSGSEISSTR